MAINQELAERIRTHLKKREGFSEKKMFGGVAFLINGNMSVGVLGDEMIVRMEPEATETALQEPGVRPFDLTGRPMKGWVMVDPANSKQSKAFSKWVRRGADFAASLPKK